MIHRSFFKLSALLAFQATWAITGLDIAAKEPVPIGWITTVAGGSVGDSRPADEATLLGPAGIFTNRAGDIFVADRFNHRIRKIDAETGIITTVAGSEIKGHWGDGGPATLAGLTEPIGGFADEAGNLFIVERNMHLIRKVDGKTGIITTIVGDGYTGGDGLGRFAGDGGQAINASLSWPEAIFVDKSGNLFIADAGNHRIRKVDGQTGIITTVAGNMAFGYTGDGRLATATSLWSPRGICVDDAGNILIADTGNDRVRSVDASTGMISTVAGDGFKDEIGRSRFAGDGGLAVSASLYGPEDVLLDAQGNILISDTGNARIRKIDGQTGIISTVAGNGALRFSGDGEPATSASMGPKGIAADGSGHLLIADRYNNRIRKINGNTGIITTIAGRASVGDGEIASQAMLNRSAGIFVTGTGDLIIADADNHRVRKVDGQTGFISTVAGNGFKDEFGRGGFSGDGTAATDARLNSPYGVFVDGAENLFIADAKNHRVRRVDAKTGSISTVAGNGIKSDGGNGGPAAAAGLNDPVDVFVDGMGNLFIADAGNHRIKKIDIRTGTLTTVAGDGYRDQTGKGRFSGDGGPATDASLNRPESVFVDGAGNVFIADAGNHRIRKIDSRTGIIATIAGDGFSDLWGRGRYWGDGGLATQSSLYWPDGIFIDSGGNLFISDAGNHRVRKIDSRTGIIATVAGDGYQDQMGLGRFWGEEIPASLASLNLPMGLFVDRAGNLLVADRLNDRVRKVESAAAPTMLTPGIGPGGSAGRIKFSDANGLPVYIIRISGVTPLVQDFEDFLAFGASYGLGKGDVRYDLQADLNEDDIVNFQDFLLFAQAYSRIAVGPAARPTAEQ